MPFFEGREFSTIHDEMPSHTWDRAKFFSDWESQIRAANDLFGEYEIRVAKETVIKGFYETYEALLEMLDEEALSENEKKEIRRRINLAMINVLEYGQRKSTNIVLSLKDRKLKPNEKGADIFNGIIDNLIFEMEKADKEFHDARQQAKK
ncbi:hypothetical protein HQ571_02290 [Candidatus Kuenenbacteria bacterium]|nr:hypothetical protein [Candidatus Kuenenbacteria bacterium]